LPKEDECPPAMGEVPCPAARSTALARRGSGAHCGVVSPCGPPRPVAPLPHCGGGATCNLPPPGLRRQSWGSVPPDPGSRDEGRALLRWPRDAPPRPAGERAEADGAHRLPADPLAPDEVLRPLRAPGLRPLPRLP